MHFNGADQYMASRASIRIQAALLIFFLLSSANEVSAFSGIGGSNVPLCSVKNIRANSALNVRAAPNLQSAQVGRVESNSGRLVKIGTTKSRKYGDWVKIQYKTVSGWASADYLDCELTGDAVVLERAAAIIVALENRDFEKLASFVHPIKGVRLTPYAYIDLDSDQVLQPSQVRTLNSNSRKTIWGYYDGTGDPIDETFNQYYEEFLFSHEFANATYLSLDATIFGGNAIDNSDEVYPTARIVEYHVPSNNPSNLDWASLRIVFDWYEDVWRLVGLVHDQWTT